MKFIGMALIVVLTSWVITWIGLNMVTGCADWSEPNCIGFLEPFLNALQ